MGSQHPQGEDVTTFEGFGSFVQSFTPQSAPPYDPHDHGQNNHHQEENVHELGGYEYTFHELDGGTTTQKQQYVAELPHEQQHYVGGLPHEQHHHHVAELPVTQWEKPNPYPEPRKIPVPTPEPPKITIPTPVPHPGPIYDDGPEVVVHKQYIPPYDPTPQPVYRPKPLPPVEPRPVKRKPPEPQKIVIREVPDPITRIEVRGLQKTGQKGVFTEILNLSAYSFLDDVAREVTKLGYKTPLGFAEDKNNAEPLSVQTGTFAESIWRILLTTGRSCYDPDVGLRMHIDEPFSVFMAKLQISVKCTDDLISINDGDLKIAFHRTLRVPEDGRVHKLPASFGRFPVKNVAAYQKKLLNSQNASLLDMAKKGGIFFPVFQREAMWISFSASAESEYKIRVFVGGVNVVTGKKWDDQSKSKSAYDKDQDYVLVPPQKHLDGIAIGNGIVQQFIAMPVGSGYSIEKQITGREDIGGVQLEVAPQKRSLSFFHRGRQVDINDSNESGIIPTPRKGGMNPGDMIRMTRSGSLNTAPFFGGKKREKQKRTLHELMTSSNPHGPMPLHVGMHALYPISLSIKIPGTLTKHKITTPPFSPLDTIQTVLKNTKHKGKDLSFFKVSHDKILQDWETIIGAGLYDGAVLTAHKDTKGGGSRLSAQAPTQMAVRPGRFSSPPTYGGPAPQGMGYNSYSSPVHQGASPGGPPMAAQRPFTNSESVYNPNTYSKMPASYQTSVQSPYTGPVSPTYAAPPSAAAPPPQTAPMTYGSPVSPASSYATPASYSMPPIQTAVSPQSATPASYSSPVSPIAPASHTVEFSYGSAAPEHDLTPLESTAYEEGPVGCAAPGHYDDAPGLSPASPSQYNASPGRLSASPDYTAPSPPMQPARPPVGSAPLPMGAASRPTAVPPMQASPPPMHSAYSPANYASLPPRQQQQQQQQQQQYQQYQPHHQQPKPKPKPPPTESWAMSLAAGGRLSQQIHLDTTPPQYRSLASPTATALINIQLLNALAYETLTGMLCPPTPITPKQYADAGIPWYNSYEPHASAVSGGAAFAQLRSVGQIDGESPIYADTSLSSGMKVACTICRRNLCDCVLRPCNHAFCQACVREKMVHAVPGRREKLLRCALCHVVAERILGFSAPMALPGQEEWIEDVSMDVAIKVGSFGRGVVFELE